MADDRLRGGGRTPAATAVLLAALLLAGCGTGPSSQAPDHPAVVLPSSATSPVPTSSPSSPSSASEATPAPLSPSSPSGATADAGSAGPSGQAVLPRAVRNAVRDALPVAVPGLVPSTAPMTRSDPLRVVITRLGINAPLTPVGRAADGTVATPPFSAPWRAGWYTGAPTPGQDGTAVIVGHVDTHTGPAVFYPLTSVRLGDTVTVRRTDGSTAVFTVDRIQVIPRAHFDEKTVFANTGHAELLLITCGGTFDRAAQEYSSNVVVSARLTAQAE